jgi:colicin import membrane protein
MHADHADDRLAFAPPQQPGLLRAFGLAVVAHLLLVLALMHGLQWKREAQNAAAEAELWSALPQEAAPREVVPPPPPPLPVVKAPPQPEPPVVQAPEPPQQRDADIALEREKQKRELEKKKLAQEKEQKRKLEAQKKREEELAKQKEQARLAAVEAKRKEVDKKRKQEQDAKKLAQLHEENLKRSLAMAGTGGPTSSGTAAQASGPSKTWAGRVVGKVRPNIVFSGETSTKWVTEVELRLAPDGTIVNRRVVKSTAPKAWDEAVLRALDKTETLPRDVDGRMPAYGTLVFSPDR